ncbi:polysaccharide deacetylase family protein [Candidatus Marithrix sp. Canyon 246]|uniref:polysaccharide deacetylase family protein n=1 Tax=Candidatus Marithrix sp. Canyon 246 TaxID=1827136 RepID=UPI000849FAFC|nr:polysaccharide deacetylase family protein [Candidatus Marithrix sp. Canyon 246]
MILNYIIPFATLFLIKIKKIIALTFDLCERTKERTGYDAAIVNYLRKHHIKATFYAGDQQLVGVVCVRYPWLRGACLELLTIAPSQQFYQKMGFIKVGQLDDLIVEGYSEFLLRKREK